MNGQETIKVLRPYQYHAVKIITQKIEDNNGNAYIWHTTGSGKTLTAFKTSEVITNLTLVKKTLFVVDRKDLDFQTLKAFNEFKEGCVDATECTKKLVEQFLEDDTKLIVTTIQKLNAAISREHYKKLITKLTNEKIVFIFDECHRSQFGETHQNIKKFFKNHQMIGFTGTPIFKENSVFDKKTKSDKTTTDLFGERLHHYLILDAINDKSVLGFCIDYIGPYKENSNASKKNLDIYTGTFYDKKYIDNLERINQIIDYIIESHERKTHNKEFNAIFCVSSTELAYKYYQAFQEKFRNEKHNLKIATIFSYTNKTSQNEDEENLENDEDIYTDDKKIDEDLKNILSKCINDYNKTYHTAFSADDFYKYYQDIQERVRNTQIDILIVVNMLLTGFDSKTLSTLYVDKELKYHNLIQAFSRTNRVHNATKSHGNIICFRDLKENVSKAFMLYSNLENNESSRMILEKIIRKPYEQLVSDFDQSLAKLQEITYNPNDIDALVTEEEKLKFLEEFKLVLRKHNVIKIDDDFNWNDIQNITEESFNSYKSKYKNIYDDAQKTNFNDKRKNTTISNFNFEIGLIYTEKIDLTRLLSMIRDKTQSTEEISKYIEFSPELSPAKDLYLQFIIELTKSEHTKLNSEKLENELEKFMRDKKDQEIKNCAIEHKLHLDGLNKLLYKMLLEEIKLKYKHIDDISEEKSGGMRKASIKDKNGGTATVIKKIQKLYARFRDWLH